MKTLLIIAPGLNINRDCIFNILHENGEHLASHFCSNWTFAWGDLYAHRPERIEKWKERFGEFEVKYIDDTDITEEELVRRNKAWYESLPKKEQA